MMEKKLANEFTFQDQRRLFLCLKFREVIWGVEKKKGISQRFAESHCSLALTVVMD